MNLAQSGLWKYLTRKERKEMIEWAETAFITSLGDAPGPRTLTIDPYWHPYAKLALGNLIVGQAREELGELRRSPRWRQAAQRQEEE